MTTEFDKPVTRRTTKVYSRNGNSYGRGLRKIVVELKSDSAGDWVVMREEKKSYKVQIGIDEIYHLAFTRRVMNELNQ